MFGWDTGAGHRARSASVLTPLPESGIVDFTNPDAYAWWRDAHQPLFEDGVDVIKSDFGEQVPDDAVAFNGDDGGRLHNVYPLLYNRCVFEATARFQPPADGPPIVWSRSAWAGSQRYPLGWGGDPQSDWEGLAASIRGGLSWGMSGNPYHSSDIGGFYGSSQPSAELFVRWLQAAVFCSHMRLHGIGEREPWAFGAEAEGVVRKWLAMRYRLIPYLEQLIAQAIATGMPVMRAMPLAFPDKPARARLRNAVHVRRRAARRADRARRRRSRHRAAAGRVVRPQFARALSRIAGAALCARGSISSRCSGAKATRCRSAAPSSIPARSSQNNPLELLWVFGKPAQPLDGYRQLRIDLDRNGTCIVRAALNVDVQIFGDAPSHQRAAAVTRRMAAHPTHCDHVGRAGRHRSGAVRDARRAPCAAALSRRGSSCSATMRCSPSARGASALAPRYARYDPLAFAPIGSAIEVWHQPLAAPAVAGPSRSDQRAQRAVDAAKPPATRARPARSPRS